MGFKFPYTERFWQLPDTSAINHPLVGRRYDKDIIWIIKLVECDLAINYFRLHKHDRSHISFYQTVTLGHVSMV